VHAKKQSITTWDFLNVRNLVAKLGEESDSVLFASAIMLRASEHRA
jgi:hypothetical protein